MTGRDPERDEIAALAYRASNGLLTLADIKRGPKVPVTVAEWDVTPGLHEWIEGEIKRQEEGEQPPHGRDCNALPSPQSCCNSGDYCECAEYNGFDAANCDCPWPAAITRQAAAARKILAAHEYSPFDPKCEQGITFGCGTCHADGDGFGYAGGNCATILALAEAYGLDQPDEQDVEVVRD